MNSLSNDNAIKTLYGHLQSWAQESPGRRLIVEPVGDEHHFVTADQLLTMSTGYANLLRERGVGQGDCVAVWLPSWSDSYAWQFAASAVGAHVVGVNTRYNITEVGHVLYRARPAVLVLAHDFQGIDFLGIARAAIAEASARARGSVGSEAPRSRPFEPPFVVATAAPGSEGRFDASIYDLGAGSCGANSEISSTSVDSIAATAAGFRSYGDPGTLSIAFTTSGSTGLPKLAAHDEFSVIHHHQCVAERIGFQPTDLMVSPLPYSGAFGHVAGMTALLGGAAVLLQPVFDPTRLLRAWHNLGGTHFLGADDVLARVRDAWRAEPLPLKSWRWTGIGDFQGMSKEIAAWTAREFGTATAGVYGSSEVFALTTFWTQDRPQDLRWSSGGTLSSEEYSYRIVDPVTNEIVPHGERGEIQLRGPNVLGAYLGDEGEMDGAFTDDGWFRSGDLGEVIDERSFIFVCRSGDVLRLRGFLVDPAEIADHLATHPDVEIAKVVGRAGQNGEPEAIAFVLLTDNGSATSQELREYCRASLARFKVPADVRILDEMPTVPGTNGAKIRTTILREWAELPVSEHGSLTGRGPVRD